MLWANHGDDISLQYAGTGALKSGFTRTGKRTYGGLVDDGVKSLTRYYLNNFSDGRKQDALDLMSGTFRIDKGARGAGSGWSLHFLSIGHLSCGHFGMPHALFVQSRLADVRDCPFGLHKAVSLMLHQMWKGHQQIMLLLCSAALCALPVVSTTGRNLCVQASHLLSKSRRPRYC